MPLPHDLQRLIWGHRSAYHFFYQRSGVRTDLRLAFLECHAHERTGRDMGGTEFIVESVLRHLRPHDPDFDATSDVATGKLSNALLSAFNRHTG